MADFTKTIDNSLNVFGIEGPNVWGTVLWNQNWGYGNVDLITAIGKLISESLTLTDSQTTGPGKMISESLSILGDMYNEGISDPAGYSRVFQVDANAENRPMTSYSRQSSSSVSFTTGSTPSTTWTRQ